MAESREAFFVYRLYDESGALLYVGLTGRTGRVDEHVHGQPWGDEVAVARMTRVPDRETGLAIEREAIWTEGPRFNVPVPPAEPAKERKAVARRPAKAVAPFRPPWCLADYGPDGAIWHVLDFQGRSMAWLAWRTEYPEETVRAMRSGGMPLPPDFRVRAAKAFQVPDSTFAPPIGDAITSDDRGEGRDR